MQNKKNNRFLKFPLWLMEWEWIDEANYLVAFLRMVDRANIEPTKWHGIDIDRGEFYTTFETLSALCKMPLQKTRTFIKRCENSGLIEKRSTQEGTSIKICRFDAFKGNLPKINIQSNIQPTYEKEPTNSNISSNSNAEKASSNIQSNIQLTYDQHTNNIRPTQDKEYIYNIYNIYKDDVEGEEPAKAGTTPPTLTEVRAFCFDKNSIVDPVRFYNYYSTRNWQGVGDWKLKIEEWENNQFSTADKQRVDKIASYRAFEAGKNNEIDLEQFFEN